MSDDVATNYVFSPFNDDLGMGSSDNSPRSSFPNNIEFRDDWIYVKVYVSNGLSVMDNK